MEAQGQIFPATLEEDYATNTLTTGLLGTASEAANTELMNYAQSLQQN
jgi:hypothetical protein